MARDLIENENLFALACKHKEYSVFMSSFKNAELRFKLRQIFLGG